MIKVWTNDEGVLVLVVFFAFVGFADNIDFYGSLVMLVPSAGRKTAPLGSKILTRSSLSIKLL